jgi:hypothetical protein
MSDRMKKILLVIGFVIVAAGLAYGLYYVFFRPAPQPAVPTPPAGIPGQLPPAGTGAPPTGVAPTPPGGLPGAGGVPGAPGAAVAPPSRTQVLRTEVTSALSLSPTGGVRSYNPADGKFYRIADNGTATLMSDQAFFDVDQVTWGNRTDKAILSYPDGSKILYDFTTNQQVTLPKHWEDFDFSPQDNQIAAKSIGNNDTNRWLVVSNPDGTGAKTIEELGDNQDKVQVNWSPNNQVIAFSETGDPIGFDRQAILLIGQNHENFKGLVVEGRDFIPKWSPSGNNLLYSAYSASDGFLPNLWVSGAAGDNVNANRRNLGLNTWADKCAWQNESTLICAVPQSLGDGAGLQRDIFSDVPDNIYKIDLTTGRETNLGQPDGAPAVNQITVSPDGKAIYFTDHATGKLIRFAL